MVELLRRAAPAGGVGGARHGTGDDHDEPPDEPEQVHGHGATHDRPRDRPQDERRGGLVAAEAEDDQAERAERGEEGDEFGHARGIRRALTGSLACNRPCPGRDSNPHLIDFESMASADWATRAASPW